MTWHPGQNSSKSHTHCGCPTTIDHDMDWNELIAEIPAVGASGDTAQIITAIEYDSRRIKPGAVFVAMKGGSTDGNRYIDKAIGNGALGIITDSSPTFDHLLVYRAGLPVLEVEHGRRALAQASAAFFGHPERKLSATGITGTNGKTTTAFLTEALLNAAATQNGARGHDRIPCRRRGAPVDPHHA